MLPGTQNSTDKGKEVFEALSWVHMAQPNNQRRLHRKANFYIHKNTFEFIIGFSSLDHVEKRIL
jgi:hypothetical protein